MDYGDWGLFFSLFHPCFFLPPGISGVFGAAVLVVLLFGKCNQETSQCNHNRERASHISLTYL
jgi:hypothetical protein